jgi:hypothetical protein
MPQVTFTDWQKGKQGYGPLLEEMIKTDADIQKRGNKATDVLQTLNTLDSIQRNPDFQSGESQTLKNRGISLAYGLIGAAKSLGIELPPEYNLDNLQAANTAKLGEMFSGLSNRLIFDALGGLGAQVSNSDRNFVSQAFPSLNMTPQGNRLLTKYLQEQYAQDKAAASAARMYRKEYGVNADAPGLLDVVQKYRDDHPIVQDKNGKYLDTPLAREIQGAMETGQRMSAYGMARPALEAGAQAAGRAVQSLTNQLPGAFTGPSPTGGYLPGVEAVRSGIQSIGGALGGGAPGAAAAPAQSAPNAAQPPAPSLDDLMRSGMRGGNEVNPADYTDVLRQNPRGSYIIRSRGKLYVRRPDGNRIPLE